MWQVSPAGNYKFKVNNRNTRTRCEICSELIKKPERRQWLTFKNFFVRKSFNFSLSIFTIVFSAFFFVMQTIIKYPVDTGRKLNVYKTQLRRGQLLEREREGAQENLFWGGIQKGELFLERFLWENILILLFQFLLLLNQLSNMKKALYVKQS